MLWKISVKMRFYLQQKICRYSQKKDYFYKCSEERAQCHHKYQLLDIACINKDKGPSMLKAHEAMIARYLKKLQHNNCRINLYLGIEDVED